MQRTPALVHRTTALYVNGSAGFVTIFRPFRTRTPTLFSSVSATQPRKVIPAPSHRRSRRKTVQTSRIKTATTLLLADRPPCAPSSGIAPIEFSHRAALESPRQRPRPPPIAWLSCSDPARDHDAGRRRFRSAGILTGALGQDRSDASFSHADRILRRRNEEKTRRRGEGNETNSQRAYYSPPPGPSEILRRRRGSTPARWINDRLHRSSLPHTLTPTPTPTPRLSPTVDPLQPSPGTPCPKQLKVRR